MKNNRRYKKYFIFLIKLILVLASYSFIVYKILKSPGIKTFNSTFINIENKQLLILLSICVLMFLNWSIEAIKWKNLIHPLENIQFKKAFLAVWTGVTIGNLTPNRIGEFAGRILFLKKINRIKATTLTLYGDLAQFIVTLVFGIGGFIILSNLVVSNHSLSYRETTYIWIFGLSLTAITSLFYFYIENIFKSLENIKIIKKTVSKFKPSIKISNHKKLITIFYSMLRYFIFTSQFYLSLRFFDINIGYYNALAAISSIYFATHVIPNIPFAEIGIRISFSLIFLGIFTDNHLSIIFSSLLIYIINVAIPSVIGGIYLIIQRNKTGILNINKE